MSNSLSTVDLSVIEDYLDDLSVIEDFPRPGKRERPTSTSTFQYHPTNNNNNNVNDEESSMITNLTSTFIIPRSRSRTEKKKKKKTPPSVMVLLAMLSGIIIFSFDAELYRIPNVFNDAMLMSSNERTDEQQALDGEKMAGDRAVQVDGIKRRLSDERMLQVMKEAWPECVNNRMNGVACKTFIDEEILSLFTGDDRLTQTVMVGKRSILDVFYNSVVILMDDDDRTVGRDGDGMVYYDFPWEGSGAEATPEEQAEIPPIIATEMNSTERSLIFEDEPILVEGSNLQEALDDLDAGGGIGGAPRRNNKPLAGGVVIDPTAPNCDPDSDSALQDALADARTQTVAPAGDRILPPFDCSCLNGYACCLLIKTLVRDADVYNKAIQCHLNFKDTSAKSKLFDEGRGKRVKIYTNHNFVVSKIPVVEGSWEYDAATA